MKTLATALAAALFLSTVVPSSAQELRGTLRDKATGQPLSQGTVQLLDSAGEVVAQAIADEGGLFLLSVSAAGTYQVRGSRLDAETVTDGPLELAQGQVLELDFLLPIDAIELAEIGVTVSGTQLLRRVGFYDRSRSSSGTFLDRATIEKSLHQTTADVLGAVRGIQIEYITNPGIPTVLLEAGARMSAATGPGSMRLPQCYPVVSLDGLRVQEGGAIGPRGDFSAMDLSDMKDLFDFGHISPSQIEGVEVYGRPSQIPAEYLTGTAMCGLIVIWTRPAGRGDGD